MNNRKRVKMLSDDFSKLGFTLLSEILIEAVELYPEYAEAHDGAYVFMDEIDRTLLSLSMQEDTTQEVNEQAFMAKDLIQVYQGMVVAVKPVYDVNHFYEIYHKGRVA